MNINGNDLEKKSPFSFFPQKRETEKARLLVKTQSHKDAKS